MNENSQNTLSDELLHRVLESLSEDRGLSMAELGQRLTEALERQEESNLRARLERLLGSDLRERAERVVSELPLPSLPRGNPQ